MLRSGDPVTLVDVREPKQYRQWHLYGSKNISLSRFTGNLPSLPKNRPIVTVCLRGGDSRKASVLLRKKGLNTTYLVGGMKAWNTIYDIVKVAPSRPTTLTVYQIKRLGKGCLSYLIIFADGIRSILVDPALPTQMLVSIIKECKLKLIAVLDTHVHADHISTSLALSKRYRIPYLLPKISDVSFSFAPMRQNIKALFSPIYVKVISTPGHTKSSVCILLDKSFLFCGDTLFLDSVGRSDLGPTTSGSARKLFVSVKKKLFKLDEDLYVLPAHTAQSMVPGPVRAATLRYVKRLNPISHYRSANVFIQHSTNHLTPTPANYQIIKEINRTGRIKRGLDLEELELGGNSCAVSLQK